MNELYNKHIKNWEKIFNIFMIRYIFGYIGTIYQKVDDLSPNYLYEHTHTYIDFNLSKDLLNVANNSNKAKEYLELWISDNLPDHITKLDIKICYLAVLNIGTFSNPFVKNSVLFNDISDPDKVKYFIKHYKNSKTTDKIKRLIKIKKTNIWKDIKNE